MMQLKTLIPPFLKLTIVITVLGNSASGQLFRRGDDSAAEKAKQQQLQQQRALQEQKQKQAAANARGAGSNTQSVPNNQSAQTGNRNNIAAQQNKLSIQRGTAPQSANLSNNRKQPVPQTRPNNSVASKTTGVFSIPQPPTIAPQPTATSSASSNRALQSIVNTQPPSVARSGSPSNNISVQLPSEKSFAAPIAASQPSSSRNEAESKIDTLTQTAVEASSNSMSDSEIEQQFGITIDPSQDGISISQLNPAGTAIAAGLRKDDKITMIGGAPVSNRSEFFEIARLLTPGDRIEIEFERSGKTEKSELQFGASANKPDTDASTESPDAMQLEGAAAAPNETTGWSPVTPNYNERLEQLVHKQQLIIQELEAKIRQLEAEKSKSF